MSMPMLLAMAMEALKLHLAAALFFIALEAPLPWLPATLAFMAAAFAGMAMRRVGSRLATHAVVNLAGLAISVFALYSSGMDPAFRGFSLPYFLVSCVLGGAFWIRGAWTGSREPDHGFILARFEEGIGLYLLVFLMASPDRIAVSTAARFSLAFFLCGITALGISKGRKALAGGFSKLPRGRAIAPLAAAFALASLGLFLVVPALQQGAEATRMAMKKGSAEFIRLLGILLSRLFRLRPAQAGFTGNGGAPLQLAEEGSSQAGRLVNILLAVTLAIVLAIVMLIIVVMLLQFLRAHASRKQRHGDPLDLSFLPAWLRDLLRGVSRFVSDVISRMRKHIAEHRRKRSPAVSAYTRLLACGRAAGWSRKPPETPREYARRLESAFPRAASQAGFIAGAIEEEVYGIKTADPASTARLVKAKRRLVPRSFLAERIGQAFRRRPARVARPESNGRGDSRA